MQAEEIRKAVVEKLGREALRAAPSVEHNKWEHSLGVVRECPRLPCGSFWGLVNHLKVFQQYLELLSEAASNKGVHASALYGGKEACKEGLEWFAPLCDDATQDEDMQREYREHVDLWRLANPGLYSYQEAAFEVHQGNPVEDRNMTKFFARLFRPCCKEYEVDVAGNILRARPSFDDFAHTFVSWREDALYHALLLAARNMPQCSQWGSDTFEWQDVLDEINRAGFVGRSRLEAVCESLCCMCPLVGSRICSVLDRVAIQMRIKSNWASEGESLDDSLAHLQIPDDLLSDPPFGSLWVWPDLKRMLESHIPPSLMCPSLYPPGSRGAWGFRQLSLALREGKLRIDTGPIGWMDRSEMGRGGELPERLHDILIRVGDATTSPEMAHLMIDPQGMLKVLKSDQPYSTVQNFYNKKFILGCMSPKKVDSLHLADCVAALKECMPATTHRYYSTPLNLLAWRLDCPPKAILYHGKENLDVLKTKPHLLPKTAHADKVDKRSVSGISLLSEHIVGASDVHLATRALVAREVIGVPDYEQHHKVTLYKGKDKQVVTSTTLAEALSFFTGPAPEKVTDVSLHESMPWSYDSPGSTIDDRYAERQTAANGLRYRDWLAMYNDTSSLHRCRLASHSIRLSNVFETHFPLLGVKEGLQYVTVASTLPSETRVLRHLGGSTRLEVLRRSVENRFMNDSKLLPLQNQSDCVSRDSMELYSDPKSEQVMLVYAPQGSKHLELMSFRYA